MTIDQMTNDKTRATILLVEDDPGVARLERLRLERAGYEVATAATAEEGLGPGRRRRDRPDRPGPEPQPRAPAAWSSSARSRPPGTTCRRSW